MNDRRLPHSVRHRSIRTRTLSRGTGTLMGRLEDVLANWEAMLPAMSEVSASSASLPPDQLLAACINDLRKAVDPSGNSKFRLPDV